MTTHTIADSPALAAWQHRIDQRLSALGDAEPLWLADLRKRAAVHFAETGLPTGKRELWRHTSPAPLTRHQWHPGGAEGDDHAHGVTALHLAPHLVPGLDAVVLVFVNGRFEPRLSALAELPDVTVGDLAPTLDAARNELGELADTATHPFAALNTVLFRDGAYVFVASDTAVARPIHILHVAIAEHGQPTAAHTRTLVVAGNGAKVTVVESLVGLGEHPVLLNAVTELRASESATLHHVRLQPATAVGHIVHHVAGSAAAGARIFTHNPSFGAPLARLDLALSLGDAADAHMPGVIVADGAQHVDNHTRIDHAQPNATSRELYRHILGGNSHAVFVGRIVVHEGAQKTDAYQNNRTLLLSPTAQIDSMPQLEIYADDVKCTHGATCGRPDDELLFYLRSRGLDLAAAQALLTGAFAAEAIDALPLPALREFVSAQLTQRLDAINRRTP